MSQFRGLIEKKGFCLLLPSEPVPSSTLQPPAGLQHVLCSALPLTLLSCAVCANQSPSSCGWPPGQLWGRLPPAAMRLPDGVAGCVTRPEPGGAVQQMALLFSP